MSQQPGKMAEDDQNLPRYAARVEEILAWRAGVPAELRFWKPDPATV